MYVCMHVCSVCMYVPALCEEEREQEQHSEEKLRDGRVQPMELLLAERHPSENTSINECMRVCMYNVNIILEQHLDTL